MYASDANGRHLSRNIQQPSYLAPTVSTLMKQNTTATLRTSKITAVKNNCIAPDNTFYSKATKSKLMEHKAIRQQSIINNRDMRPIQLSASADAIASKLSKIPKLVAKKEINKPLMCNDRTKITETALIVATKGLKSTIAKPSKIRSLSATAPATSTSITQQNLYHENNSDKDQVSPHNNEMAIQTNEREIMDHSLVVGDLKIMKPSKVVVDEIEKLRHQIKTENLLKATRKFEEHSAREEAHLDDLNEFLEKSYVTKKERKIPKDLFVEDRKIFASMDQLWNREIPKTESINDIAKRIELKEQELLSLFGKVKDIHPHPPV